jgi:HSP20 family protein
MQIIHIVYRRQGKFSKDIEVLLTDNTLTIRGEKREEREEKGKSYYHMERSYGSFNRVIPLPAGVDQKKVQAQFINGLPTGSRNPVTGVKGQVRVYST